MSEPKRVSRGRAIYLELQRHNMCLQRELQNTKRELREVEAANLNLQVERDAADVLLGEAMDQALGNGNHA